MLLKNTTSEKRKSSVKNMFGLQATFQLAEKMGKSLG
jgi:hypothetical protein